MNKKVDILNNIIENNHDLSLHDSDIHKIFDTVEKVKKRIEDVLNDPHPEDNQSVTDKLKSVLSNLQSALLTLSEIKGQLKNGK